MGSIFKNGWAKPDLNFIGLVISTWDPGTHLQKRLKRGDPGINRLDRIAKQHDIDYSLAKILSDKHAADRKMIKAIDRFGGRKTNTEKTLLLLTNKKKVCVITFLENENAQMSFRQFPGRGHHELHTTIASTPHLARRIATPTSESKGVGATTVSSVFCS